MKINQLLAVLSPFLFSLVPLLTHGQESTPPSNDDRPRWQSPRERERKFVESEPTIGDPIPNVSLMDAKGNSVSTESFRGKYVVITFGCLT